MAKRKKNRMQDDTMTPEEIGAAQGKFGDLMEDLAKKVKNMNFATEEELSEFLNSGPGKPCRRFPQIWAS